MKEGEIVSNYFARTLTIANKMHFHGETMTDVTVIEKILRSMISKFDYVVCSIEESKDLDTMSIDELQSSLLYECPKKGKEKESQAHYAETTEPLLLMAYVDVTEMVGQKKESRGYFSELDTLEVDNYTKELLLMAHVKKAPDETAWFLDSGCNNHMCGHKEFFSELDESFRKFVKLGDNSRIGVMGKGNIHLQVNHVSQVITKDDSHAEAIQASLDWSDIDEDNNNNIQDEAIDNNSSGTGHEEGSGSISADNHGGFHEENLEHQTAEGHTTA
ncbi:hypothetical protein F0562_028332 [Nyssa sinensis]|uniref:Retrovirus-related Pol polyprotein from transposon TNT 1-94-like beta-barrel domain-containing protein n=1 Tax=Nyssa sinensis TaxID=561372 RepID=A0A5J5BAA1_9ASTE|nr:hypothetical protein F0562_028332 [Nyssa sinensis]